MHNSQTNTSANVPFIGDSKSAFDYIKVGMFKYSYLMGTFPFPPPVSFVNLDSTSMILLGSIESQGLPLESTYIEDLVLQHMLPSNILTINQDPSLIPHPFTIESLK